MGHYNNFKTVVYIPAEVAEKFTQEKLASDWEWIEKYIGLTRCIWRRTGAMST